MKAALRKGVKRGRGKGGGRGVSERGGKEEGRGRENRSWGERVFNCLTISSP